MKKLILAVLAVSFAVMFFGCGDNGVNPTPPNTGPWDITFYAKYTDASSTEGVVLHVLDGPPIGGNIIATLPVLQGATVDSVTVLDLERNIEYYFSFWDPDEEVITLKLGDQEENFFSLSLLDGEEASNLQIPAFSLVAKPVPTVLVLNIFPTSAEAEIWIDGDSLGSANANGYFETTVDPGDREITLIGWGCKEKTVSIAISPGETKTQNISLEVWDLSGKWKRESDDKEVDVEKEADERGIYWFSFKPCWLTTKGNRVFKTVDQEGDYAEGVILDNGKRIEFTFHTQYGSTLTIYNKIS